MVWIGSDQNIQHLRSHRSTKTKSGQLEWEMVRVMLATLSYDVDDSKDQIPVQYSIYLLLLLVLLHPIIVYHLL